MGTVLHMDTGATRATANQLSQGSQSVSTELRALRSRVQGLDWIGPGRDLFVNDVEQWISATVQLADQLDSFSRRLITETDEWEFAGSELALAAPRSAFVSDWGAVLGAVDTQVIETSDPNFLDWAGTVYESVETVAGEVAAKTMFSKWLSGLGTLFKGFDLAQSSSEIQTRNQAMYAAQAQFGTASTEFLLARWDYSNAELKQLFGAIYPLLHSVGLWDGIVTTFEDAKYR